MAEAATAIYVECHISDSTHDPLTLICNILGKTTSDGSPFVLPVEFPIDADSTAAIVAAGDAFTPSVEFGIG